MELIGFGITVAAVIWGAVQVMKHFFPSWQENVYNQIEDMLHDRVRWVEDEVVEIKSHIFGTESKDPTDNPPPAA